MPPGPENGTCPILQLPATVDQFLTSLDLGIDHLGQLPQLLPVAARPGILDLGIDHLGQLPQLLPVAARPGIATDPLLAIRRPRPGGLSPRLPLSD